MITEGTTAVGARAARSASSRTRQQGVPLARPGRSGRAVEAPDEPESGAPDDAAPASEGSLMWRRIAWLVSGVAWVFCALSLLSYSTGDAPAAGVYPHNEPPHNLCGIAGAMLAHYSYQLVGSGAIVLLLLGALWLGISATGRRVNQVPLRVLGALMMAASIAGLQALLLPTTGPVPSLPGGLAGSLGAARLVASFSQVGTFLVLALMLCIGAIVTLDVWAVLVAIWTGRAIYVSAKTSGRVALAAARAANERRQQYRAGRLAYAGGGGDWDGHGGSGQEGMGGGRSAYVQRGSRTATGPRLDDVSDDEELPTLADSRTTRILKARPAGAGAGAKAGNAIDAEDDPSLFDPAQSAGLSAADPKRKTDTIVADPDAPSASPSASEPVAARQSVAPGSGTADAGTTPRTYSPDELRAKMAKLPVRFAAKTARAATDEDLRELQERGAEEADTGGKGGGTGPMNLEGYRFPGLDLLEEPEANFSQTMEAFVREQAENLERALREYRIDGEVVGVESGPVITLYEVRLAPGTKVAVLQAVSSDLARALKSVNIRIVANTAGRDTVGIEVPNLHKEKVRLKELMNRGDIHSKMMLPMFLGKDASGEPLICDLATIPHLLIAGTTGSGKSVCMNTIIMSFLYTKKPNELKLVLVDPKMVELSQFKDIPHLMCPVVTEMGKAAAILEWAVAKMDERYELLAEAGCRDISGYNALEWDELKERLGVSTPEEEAKVPRKLPYMVFVIDELADLMMTNKEVEHSIVRIAQKARAVGMHLIVATQRPQANVVTGLIKSNMPGRMAFKVASGMDSRIVLDQKGGELLLGQGDMLYLSPRSSKLTRAQGTLVDDKEIRRVVKFMREVAQPTFERSLMQIRPGMSAEQAEAGGAGTLGGMGRDSAGAEGVNGNFNWGDRDGFQAAQEDPMFDEAVEVVIESRRGSVSMLQRRLAIGYTRAARLIEMMGEAGILGGHKGTVSRDVIMTLDEWRAIKAQAAADAAAAEGLSTGPDGALNSHPKTGETLEVVQARLNGTGGDGGRTGASPTRGTDLPAAAAFAAEQEEQDEDLVDDVDDEYEDDESEDHDDSQAVDELDDDDDSDEAPFKPDVQTRRPGSQTRA